MKYLFSLVFFVTLSLIAFGQEFPEKMIPPRAINDFVNFLSVEEQNSLEQKLRNYNDTTSTAIVVAIVSSLYGYEVNDYATRLFNNWQIGTAKNDNGVLLLIKPKSTDGKGQVAIITGYGAEGMLPDALCKRIISNEIVPRFMEGQFYTGIDAAINTMIELSRGNYSADQYLQKTQPKKQKKSSGLILIIIVFVIIYIIGSIKNKGGGHISSRGDIPFWILLSMLGSRNSGGGSFGDFNSGGGIFGGGDSGGFGGFGGGSSGGGGASGSW